MAQHAHARPPAAPLSLRLDAADASRSVSHRLARKVEFLRVARAVAIHHGHDLVRRALGGHLQAEVGLLAVLDARREGGAGRVGERRVKEPGLIGPRVARVEHDEVLVESAAPRAAL